MSGDLRVKRLIYSLTLRNTVISTSEARRNLRQKPRFLAPLEMTLRSINYSHSCSRNRFREPQFQQASRRIIDVDEPRAGWGASFKAVEG